jgi:hypothetical protein
MLAVLLILLGLLGYSIAQQAGVSAQNSGETAPPQNTVNETGVTVYESDASLTGTQITSDQTTWPGSDTDKIWNICAAVALAEGYNLGDGCAPYDLNNPGDLSPGDEAGQLTSGPAQQHGGSAIIVFATAEAGWQALYTKFYNIVHGKSKVYPSTWTWEQVGTTYAGNSANWIKNVTSYLGVDPSSTPAQYVNS